MVQVLGSSLRNVVALHKPQKRTYYFRFTQTGGTGVRKVAYGRHEVVLVDLVFDGFTVRFRRLIMQNTLRS